MHMCFGWWVVDAPPQLCASCYGRRIRYDILRWSMKPCIDHVKQRLTQTLTALPTYKTCKLKYETESFIPLGSAHGWRLYSLYFPFLPLIYCELLSIAQAWILENPIFLCKSESTRPKSHMIGVLRSGLRGHLARGRSTLTNDYT